jgi:hypothetical protein
VRSTQLDRGLAPAQSRYTLENHCASSYLELVGGCDGRRRKREEMVAEVGSTNLVSNDCGALMSARLGFTLALPIYQECHA